MDPNRLNERRDKDRRQKNIPITHDRRKGNRREGKERRKTDWWLFIIASIFKTLLNFAQISGLQNLHKHLKFGPIFSSST